MGEVSLPWALEEGGRLAGGDGRRKDRFQEGHLPELGEEKESDIGAHRGLQLERWVSSGPGGLRMPEVCISFLGVEL